MQWYQQVAWYSGCHSQSSCGFQFFPDLLKFWLPSKVQKTLPGFRARLMFPISEVKRGEENERSGPKLPLLPIQIYSRSMFIVIPEVTPLQLHQIRAISSWLSLKSSLTIHFGKFKMYRCQQFITLQQFGVDPAGCYLLSLDNWVRNVFFFLQQWCILPPVLKQFNLFAAMPCQVHSWINSCFLPIIASLFLSSRSRCSILRGEC